MLTPEFLQDISADPDPLLPYLCPDYWDGHSIGKGEIGEYELSMTLDGQRMAASQDLYAYRQKNKNRESFSLEHFAAGQTFDPNNFEQGTIIRHVGETLLATGEVEIDYDSLEPFRCPPQFAVDGYGRARAGNDDESLVYQRETMWGVVMDTRDKRKALTLISQKAIEECPLGGRYLRQFMVWGRTTPFKIGEVEHINVNEKNRPKHEVVRRTLAMDVVANGAPQKARQGNFIATVLRRLVTGQ